MKATNNLRVIKIRYSCNRITCANKNTCFTEFRAYTATNNCKNNCHENMGKHRMKKGAFICTQEEKCSMFILPQNI